MMEDFQSGDEVVNVKLTIRDYKILREVLDDRKAVNGFKSISRVWATRLFWVAGGILSLFGVYDFLIRISGK